MPTPTVPRHPIGVVDDTQYGTIVNDVYEYIGELTHPASVTVYGQMRHDSKLAAVLAGYTLQLRRASWQLDGAGCRDEVVQHVADDLGIPVMGSDDKPTGARLRDVSWNQHLRAALQHLIWGHYGFELAAEIVDGRAHLTTLAERQPATIAAVHADPRTGRLLGVDQTAMSKDNSPQIKADRIVWYVNDREGANWTGRSVLRSAYAPWLIKREMMRVAAISNRRWGAGVPVAVPSPGTNPTAAQLTDAQRLASAARAGDVAGAAMPANFDLKIVGLSGSVPDTLGFIRWLDQQMTSAALMSHLDLGGETRTGSYALGRAFVDLLMMALESIGEHVADTATREVVARVVGWNWGTDEPVPRITVSGIGSQRQVTAESLQMLLSSGAMSADPALEEWVRREYRLPEREQPVEPAAFGGVVIDGEPPPEGEGEAPAVDSSPVTSADDVFAAVPAAGRLARVTDDKLALGLTRLAQRQEWGTLETVDDEMIRREAKTGTPKTKPAPHWAGADDSTAAEWRVDALLAQGYDVVAAYRQIYGSRGDSAALRRGYDLWAAEQTLLGGDVMAFEEFAAQVRGR